jgi:anti-anti-sigma factor
MSDVRQLNGDFRCEPLDNGTRGLKLIGELDVATVDELRSACDRLPGTGSVTLDVSQLTFIDSSGLHAIVQYASDVQAEGPVVVTNASAHMARLFDIVTLDGDPAIEVRASNGR